MEWDLRTRTQEPPRAGVQVSNNKHKALGSKARTEGGGLLKVQVGLGVADITY